MTVYNGEKFLSSTIKSVLNQSFKNYEFIIINDGSTDETQNILNSFSDQRIKIIHSEQHKGVALQKMELLKHAKAKLINFIDADDLIHQLKFEKQLKYLKNNPEIGLLGTSTIVINESGIKIKKLKIAASSERIKSIMLFRNYFINSSVIFRNHLLDDFNPENLFDFEEDYLFWWHIIKKSNAYNLNEYLTFYRYHNQSMTNRIKPLRYELDKKVYILLLKEIRIEASEHELELHYFLSQPDLIYSFFQLRQLLKWLYKIKKHCKKNGMANYKLTILNRWMKICFKSRNHLLRFIYSLTKFYKFI